MGSKISREALQRARKKIWVGGPRLLKLDAFANEVIHEYEQQGRPRSGGPHNPSPAEDRLMVMLEACECRLFASELALASHQRLTVTPSIDANKLR